MSTKFTIISQKVDWALLQNLHHAWKLEPCDKEKIIWITHREFFPNFGKHQQDVIYIYWDQHFFLSLSTFYMLLFV